MLTDDQARALLNAAADTIDVPPARPIPLPRRRPSWVLPLTAAAVLAVVAGTLAVVIDSTHHASGPVAPSGTISTQPWPAPSDRDQLRLAPDQMPSLLGYTAMAATKLLESHGIAVRIDRQPCSARGRVLGSEPAVGTVLQGTSPQVELEVGGGMAGTCQPPVETAGERLAYRLLDWANGRGPAPRFARTVTLYRLPAKFVSYRSWQKVAVLQGGGASRHSALDRNNWGGWLTDLANASRMVQLDEGHRKQPHYLESTLSVERTLPRMGTVPGLKVELVISRGETPGFELAGGIIRTNHAGAITAVYIDPNYDPTARLGKNVPPDVEGDTLAFAEHRLREQGFAVSVSGPTTSTVIVRHEEFGSGARQTRLTTTAPAPVVRPRHRVTRNRPCASPTEGRRTTTCP